MLGQFTSQRSNIRLFHTIGFFVRYVYNDQRGRHIVTKINVIFNGTYLAPTQLLVPDPSLPLPLITISILNTLCSSIPLMLMSFNTPNYLQLILPLLLLLPLLFLFPIVPTLLLKSL